MHIHFATLAAIAAGGAVGASFRYLLGIAMTHWFGSGFPWGTFTTNILGALLMGSFIALMLRFEVRDPAVQAFLTTGLLGGFTTFSTFSLEMVLLFERNQHLLAAVYAVSSVILCVGGVFLMMWLLRPALQGF
ncbi:MAG: fluoride efflux transporter CrcB [Rhodospirillales bacterium]|nr:fluoride efflux transporter CrcB [Rhodospirillales bacterium]